MVGGRWDELGRLQFDFLVRQGLSPNQRLLDIGCGCLRGGLHFVRFLEAGNYFGLDMNYSLLEAGRMELAAAGLECKNPTLLLDEKFDLSRLGERFPFVLAMSVFTHLFMNQIARCLVEVEKVLGPGGRFFATIFRAPRPAHLEPIVHPPGEIRTFFDADPFHVSLEEIDFVARNAGLTVHEVEDWRHPRGQVMLQFDGRS
jgi:cyclopropane fatty-acyl-phospholipid synthase-like methyltransferase